MGGPIPVPTKECLDEDEGCDGRPTQYQPKRAAMTTRAKMKTKATAMAATMTRAEI